MKPNANNRASKHRPRGFESLESRYVLNGTDLVSPRLPSTICPSPPLLGMTVYASPIGPVPVSSQPAIAYATSPTMNLPPISLAYIQRLSVAAPPIGPAQPAMLPSQLLTFPAQPPASPPPALSAEGVLPTNQTPANLPTTRQTLPVVTDPPSPPAFTRIPSIPLY